MAFKVFQRISRQRSTVPIVKIHSRGTISLNSPAYQLLRDTQKDNDVKEGSEAESNDRIGTFIEFVYDSDERIVGLRLAPQDSENAYAVRKQKSSEYYLVTGTKFLAFHDIPCVKVKRHVARIYDDNILGFCLDDEAK